MGSPVQRNDAADPSRIVSIDDSPFISKPLISFLAYTAIEAEHSETYTLAAADHFFSQFWVTLVSTDYYSKIMHRVKACASIEEEGSNGYYYSHVVKYRDPWPACAFSKLRNVTAFSGFLKCGIETSATAHCIGEDSHRIEYDGVHYTALGKSLTIFQPGASVYGGGVRRFGFFP